jgi:hypothetical protein
MFALPVTRNAAEGWDLSNTDPRGLEVVDTLKFVLPATLQSGNVKALRVQDILVFDIIRTSRWQRPIYFASTGGDESKIGLQDHMEMRGLAMKLVPRKMRSFWDGVNEEVLGKQLMTDVQTPSRTPAFGFRWRGLSDTTVHLDENQRRLIMNYRQAFFAYSFYLTNVKQAPKVAVAALNRMESVLPRSLLVLDYHSKYDIAQIYSNAGDMAHACKYASELVSELSHYMSDRIAEPLDQYNPLIVLAQAHEMLGAHDNAIAAMNRLGEVYSSTPGVAAFVQQKVAEFTIKKINQLQPRDMSSPKDKTKRSR